MLRSVFGKTLRDQRRPVVAWAIGIAAVGVLYAAFYPTINSPEMVQALEAYPEGLLEAIGFTDVTSAAGYLGSTTFGLLGPALLIVHAASLGGGAVAGDEESGRLDLVLAHPVSRWTFLLQRFAALVVAVSIACALLWVALLAISGPADLGAVGPANLLAGSVHLALLGILFGAIAIAVGAATGRKSLAFVVVAVIAVGGYLANNLAPSVEGLAWLQSLSPFQYHLGGSPLRNGIQPVDLGVLAGASALLVLAGGLAFDRRDVAV